MKLKEFFHLLGLKPAPIRYGSEIQAVELARDGMVEYARWLHPRARNLLVRELRPLLQVEFFTERKATPGYRVRLLDYLTGHGYRIYRVEERSGDWLQEEIGPGNVHRHKTFDAFCIPREMD